MGKVLCFGVSNGSGVLFCFMNYPFVPKKKKLFAGVALWGGKTNMVTQIVNGLLVLWCLPNWKAWQLTLGSSRWHFFLGVGWAFKSLPVLYILYIVVGKWETQVAPTKQKENGVSHCHYVWAAHLKWSQCVYSANCHEKFMGVWERGTCSGDNLWVQWGAGHWVISTYSTLDSCLISICTWWMKGFSFLSFFVYSTTRWKCFVV